MSDESPSEEILDAIVFEDSNKQPQILAIILTILLLGSTVFYFMQSDDKSTGKSLFSDDYFFSSSDVFVTDSNGMPVNVKPVEMKFFASDVGEAAPEPSVGITSSGCVFFIALEKVMRSCDGGITWAEVQGPACSPTTSDPYGWVDPITDRVFGVQMIGLETSWICWSDNDGQSWRSRVAGDEDTNTDPSFVGNTINDIFFHRNRLGIISGENVIFSETSNFFNFYRTTVRALLDSDPIDVAVSQNEVSELKAALPIQDSLLLFSELNQFTLSASQLLTPAEVTIDQSTKFECDLRTPPVGAGNSVFFNTVGGNFAGVREYYTDGETEIKDATLITSHVPEYLSGNVRKMAASTNEDMLICLTSAVKSEAYVYKWYNSNNERLQSSWSKWTFDKNVADITFNNSDLYITFEDGSYEKITLRNPVKDITYSEARVLSAGVGTVGGVSQINFTPYQITLGIPADPNILGSMVTWVSYFAYAITGLCTLTLDTRVLRFTYKETGEKVTAFILNGVTYEVSNATSVDEAGGNYFFTLPQSEVDALNGQSFQPTVVTGSTDVVIFNTKSHDVLLDHRTKIQLADGTSSYSTSSIPYTATSNTVFVDHSGRIIAKGTGDLQKVVDFLFEGNAPKQHLENGAAVNNYVYAGEPYTFKYQLSEQVFTPTDGDTTKLGRFQLRSMAFNFNDTGTFNVAVKSTGRDTVNHRFTGRLLGDSNNFLGYSAIVDDETFKVGVQSQAKETDITITNDTHLPCVFQSAEYEAWATLRNRRL